MARPVHGNRPLCPEPQESQVALLVYERCEQQKKMDHEKTHIRLPKPLLLIGA